MKSEKNNVSKTWAFIRIAMQHILMLCMFIGLVSCEDKQQQDGPCLTAEGYLRSIQAKTNALNNMDFWDQISEGVGLSSKIRELFEGLRGDLVAYRDHMCKCRNSHCREMADEEIKKCNELIKACANTKDSYDFTSVLSKAALLLCL